MILAEGISFNPLYPSIQIACLRHSHIPLVWHFEILNSPFVFIHLKHHRYFHPIEFSKTWCLISEVRFMGSRNREGRIANPHPIPTTSPFLTTPSPIPLVLPWRNLCVIDAGGKFHPPIWITRNSEVWIRFPEMQRLRNLKSRRAGCIIILKESF